MFNAGNYLRQALDSVIRQNYRPMEIIIVNDGSNDNSSVIISEFCEQQAENFENLAWHDQKNRGLAATRNKLITMANGDLIAFIDADDIWVDRKLELQMDIFDKYPGAELISGKIAQFISPEIPQQQHHEFKFHSEPVQSNMMGVSLIHASTFEKYGEFNPAYPLGSDMQWVAQALSNGLKVVECPELLCYRRLHDNNLARGQSEANFKLRFEILRNSIAVKNVKSE